MSDPQDREESQVADDVLGDDWWQCPRCEHENGVCRSCGECLFCAGDCLCELAAQALPTDARDSVSRCLPLRAIRFVRDIPLMIGGGLVFWSLFYELGPGSGRRKPWWLRKC